MTSRFLCFVVFLLSLAVTSSVHARDAQVYPSERSVSEGDETYELTLTGQAKRIFLFFNVYEVAHYVQTANRAYLSLDNVLDDGAAKALAITFSRKLGREKIREELDNSLRRNARAEWLAAAEPTINAFMNAIDRDALDGDQLVFYWLSGGRIFAEFNGERAFAVTDTAFAKLIWSIWFGEKPACDREALLASSMSIGDQ
ncbi:MAG: chalcone isomerase family protein [Congregibacter sp.]